MASVFVEPLVRALICFVLPLQFTNVGSICSAKIAIGAQISSIQMISSPLPKILELSRSLGSNMNQIMDTLMRKASKQFPYGDMEALRNEERKS